MAMGIFVSRWISRLKADKHPAFAIHWLYWHLPVSYTHLDVYKRQQYAWRVYRQLPAQRSAQFGKHLVSTATTIPSLISVRVSP